MISQQFLQHYNEVAGNHPDSIVFKRSGIFYLAIGENAKKAAELCGLKLQAEGDYADPIAVCGFPKSALDKYTGKLLRSGCSVIFAHDENEIERIRSISE